MRRRPLPAAALAALLLAGTARAGVEVDAGDPRLQRAGASWLLSGRPFDGLIRSRTAEGLRAEQPVRNGLREGLTRSWYPDGSLAEQRAYAGGRKNGAQSQWWPGGMPRLQAQMRDDRPVGQLRTWYADGRPYEEHRYDDAGHESGLQRVWYEDGSLRANYVVRDGRRYGTTGPRACAGKEPAGAVQ